MQNESVIVVRAGRDNSIVQWYLILSISYPCQIDSKTIYVPPNQEKVIIFNSLRLNHS